MQTNAQNSGVRASGRDVTVIVPAYNEADTIASTLASMRRQTLEGVRVLVVDDGSTDQTGEIARSCGADVVRPPQNTGSKAGAQNFALDFVETRYVVALDADTTLAPDALEIIIAKLAEAPNAAAACGYVLPRRTQTVWELGRLGEYLFALGFYKRIQGGMGRPLISSGCFSAYRTDALRAAGGWSDETVTEDVDLTWTFYASGREVLFVPEAMSYPLEPADLTMLGKQLKRWSHGFIQNLVLHRQTIMNDPTLRAIISVMMWDSTMASLLYLIATPLLAIFVSPWALAIYLIDLPVIAGPILLEGWRAGTMRSALLSIPAFFVLRLVNSVYFVRAAVSELLLGRRLAVYEKGH